MKQNWDVLGSLYNCTGHSFICCSGKLNVCWFSFCFWHYCSFICIPAIFSHLYFYFFIGGQFLSGLAQKVASTFDIHLKICGSPHKTRNANMCSSFPASGKKITWVLISVHWYFAGQYFCTASFAAHTSLRGIVCALEHCVKAYVLHMCSCASYTSVENLCTVTCGQKAVLANVFTCKNCISVL